MTITREIAILRADTMIGSDFILPVLIKRVVADAFPTIDAVYALMMQGGFAVEVKTVDLEVYGEISGDTLCDALERAFSDILGSRPLFVDVATGDLYVTRGKHETYRFLAPQGNLFEAFSVPVPATEEMLDVIVDSRVKILPVAAVRTARPDLGIKEIKEAIDAKTPIAMSRRDLARTLIQAVAISATRHQEITAGRITGEFGCYRPNDVISRCSVERARAFA